MADTSKVNKKRNGIQSKTAVKLEGVIGTQTEAVRHLKTPRSTNFRLQDVKVIGRKRSVRMLELPGLVTGTMVASLQ